MRLCRVLAGAGVLGLLLTACGGDHDTATHPDGGRIMDVTMMDNSFAPDRVRVTEGETVTFRFRNDGLVRHEAVIGDDARQAEHHAEMTASTGADMGTETEAGPEGDEHGDGMAGDGSITVEPGDTGELTHMFTESGSILIGCHEPGHWEDGMKATVNIS